MRDAWLTLHYGDTVCHLRADAVVAVAPHPGGGSLVFDGSLDPWEVNESAEAVLGMITALDWAGDECDDVDAHAWAQAMARRATEDAER